MAYCIVQAQCPSSIFTAFKVVENFINYEIYEEAAPISTIETAFQIILLEYSDHLLKNQKPDLNDEQI